MIFFGITGVYNNLKRTFLMSIQIAIVLFIGLVLVSTYKHQSLKYNPFKNLLEEQGVSLYADSSFYNQYGGVNEMVSQMKSVKSYSAVSSTAIIINNDDEQYTTLYGYDDLTASYVPQMAEGVWFTAATTGDAVNVVLSSNEFGIKAGDDITISDGNISCNAHVCGVMESNASCYNPNRWKLGENIYDMYSVFGTTGLDGTAVFMSESDIARLNIPSYYSGRVLIGYDEDISDKDLEWNKGFYDSPDIEKEDFHTIRKATEHQLWSRLLVVVPVAVGAFILITFGTVTLTAVDTLIDMKKYAVLYICGMKWTSCVVISIIRSAITALIGLMIMIFGENIFLLVSRDSYYVSWGLAQIVMCIAIITFFVIASGIMPLFILKKNPPVKVLRMSSL